MPSEDPFTVVNNKQLGLLGLLGLLPPLGYLELFSGCVPLLRALTRLFTWLVCLVAWLGRIFDGIGVVEKYLEAIVALNEFFFDYPFQLCEKSPLASELDRSALSDDLFELARQLSVIVENGGEKV